MKVAIHWDTHHADCIAARWARELNNRGVGFKRVNLLGPAWVEEINGCSGVLWRWGHSPFDKFWAWRVLYTIESYLNIPTYPSIADCWHYDDKLSQHYLLHAAGAPLPKTYIFSDRSEAFEWAATTSYPKVFKLACGASSGSVLLVQSRSEAEVLINRMFVEGIYPTAVSIPDGKHSLLHRCWRAILREYRHENDKGANPWLWRSPQFGYALFQDFIPGNAYDTRITIIGKRAFGFRRMNRPGDFRASGSGRILQGRELINEECIRIAFEVSERLGFSCMAYDFLFLHGNPVMTEVSYTFMHTAVFNCPGHWLGDMTYVEGQMWPEVAQVEDFLAKLGG